MSELNNVVNILETLECIYYEMDGESFSIINTSNAVDTYHITKELIAIKNKLNYYGINYQVDGDINILLDKANSLIKNRSVENSMSA